MIIKDETEKTIIGIIENTCRGDYDSAIRSIWDPGVFFHLSSLREGLVRWMPLRQGSCVLEIGGGFGALTGAILSMCGSVDVTEPDVTLADAIRTRYKDCENLRVTADVPVKRYDYIFLMDADEKIAGRETETLGMYRRMLSDNGVLIVGFRNRFGVKYWCGGTDDKVTEPFTAITGTCSSGEAPGCQLYSKREIEAFAKQAGFGKGLFYYPMPNEFFPQAIVSDEEPPTESIADRVFPVDPFDSPVIVGEREILPELIRGGLLTELADYVIAVFKRDGTVPKRRPVYAALSMDRGKERGFATVIFSDDTVRKKALFPEGMPVLEVLQRNAEELSKRNVRTVLHKLEDGEIVMPRVREQSMLSYIESAQKPDDVRGVFRALWENILKSSEAADMADESNDIRGPILRTGYIDMIPYNCFMTGDGPLYYDQEFMVENCPAGYIMFRAIKYTYIHLPELERLIPQAELRKDYGLTDELWKTYEDQEKEFVKENRRSELFPQVYRWSWRNNAGIDERRRLIAGGSAEAADAVLLKKVHDVQFGILKEIDRVCKELGLRYFAIHGTLLGAVRDGKPIPWDDDMDVAMLREDYDRFMEEAGSILKKPYVLQTPENDNRCFYGGYAKLRNDNTAALEYQNIGRWCSQGIWIDILPLDNCPADEKGRADLKAKIDRVQRIIYVKKYPNAGWLLQDVPGEKISGYFIRAKGVKVSWMLNRLRKLFTGRPPTGYLSVLACYYGELANRNVYEASYFSSAEMMKFGDMEIPVPIGYDSILTARYGEGYMSVPEPGRRRRKHTVYFDPDRSWRDIDQYAVMEDMRKMNDLSLKR